MPTTATPAASTRDKLLRAREAAAQLLELSTSQKNAILLTLADALEANCESILQANRADLDDSGLEGAMLDRLMLNPARVKEMARGVREVASLPDRIFEVLSEWTRPNGLRLRKIRVPLGVIGII
ncbi:MAG TPA: gamma-glutamyl-phosphate reductase, partial [Terriglobales bacterium]